MTLPDAMELARLNGELGLALTEALVEIDRLRLAATPAPLDARGTPYSMESVRSWMGLDVWLSLGHDFHDWPGWTADGWADMMAEIRPLAATPAPPWPRDVDPEPPHTCPSCGHDGLPPLVCLGAVIAALVVAVAIVILRE